MTSRSVPYGQLARRLVLGTWLAMAPIALATAADAQPSDAEIVKAREQFRQGLGLEAAGDWAGALAQFEQVARVKVTPQVRFHVARCQHKLGKLLEALGGYRLAAHEALHDPKGAETLAEARKGIEDVEAKIPKLIIERGTGAEIASVHLDGVALGESSVGKEVPVNPGTHTVEFAFPDGRKDKRLARLEEGKTIKIVLNASPDEQTGLQTSPARNGGTTEKSNRVLPWVAMGVGGASLATSGVFYLMRSKTIADHDEQCVDNLCPRSLEDTGNKGKTYSTLANVTLGVGLLGIGIGTILWMYNEPRAASSAVTDTARKKSPPPTLTVVAGGNGEGAEASLVGTF